MIHRYLIFPAIWAIFIAFALLIPGGEIPAEGITLPHFDKIVHFLLFAVLCFLLAQAFKKQFSYIKLRFKEIRLSLMLSFSYGFLLEIMQYLFFSGRYFEWLDLLANFMGCLAGIAAYKLIYFRI